MGNSSIVISLEVVGQKTDSNLCTRLNEKRSISNINMQKNCPTEKVRPRFKTQVDELFQLDALYYCIIVLSLRLQVFMNNNPGIR